MTTTQQPWPRHKVGYLLFAIWLVLGLMGLISSCAQTASADPGVRDPIHLPGPLFITDRVDAWKIEVQAECLTMARDYVLRVKPEERKNIDPAAFKAAIDQCFIEQGITI